MHFFFSRGKENNALLFFTDGGRDTAPLLTINVDGVVDEEESIQISTSPLSFLEDER